MIRTFLDSSVLIAAIRSPAGGSGEVLRCAAAELVKAVISEDVVAEVEGHFRDKLPRLIPLLRHTLNVVPFDVVTPTIEDITVAAQCTPSKDKLIVAGALRGNVDYLVTLDKKHLLSKKEEIGQHVNFEVVRPGEILEVIRGEFS